MTPVHPDRHPMNDGETRLIGGLHAIRSLLQQGEAKIVELWAQSGRHDQRFLRILALAETGGVPVRQVARKALDEMAPATNHQGLIARIGAPVPRDERFLRQLLESLDVPPFLLILDKVQDPHNLGACMRSADAAGVHAVITPKDRAVGLTATVVKVASGAAESVPLVQVTNLSRTLRALQQEHGIWLVGTAPEAESTLFQADLKGPLGMVLGGEEKGLRRLTRERCDLLVSLPMVGVVESLNVSVAAGICLYEAVRQRIAATPKQ